jgi:glycosyltransferase involved in cell wall biosynthesis
VFVYPSVYEGFGLPPLEAMGCGAPVIASDIPSISEAVDSAALLVKPEVDDLTNGLIRLLDDPSLREELSKAGKRRVAEFSWSQTAKQMREVYEESIERYCANRKG